MNSVPLFWLGIFALIVMLLAIIIMGARFARIKNMTRETAADVLRMAQMEELERNRNSGAISEDEAAAMKSEIERAYSRALRRGEDGESRPAPKFATIAVLALTFIASVIFYNRIGAPALPDIPFAMRAEMERPSQQQAREYLAEENALPIPEKPTEEFASLINELEAVLEARPNETEGHRMLARVLYSISDYQRAADAQLRYIALAGDTATADDYALLAENLILAVNGYVSPEAEEAIRASLIRDGKNQIARFYAAMLAKQEREFGAARQLLQGLLDEGIENPDWQFAIESELAALAPAKGPSDEDIANAAEMSDEERQAMIGGMVDGLKARLAEEGGAPAEWARLINALRVLERHDEADAILGEARSKFPDAPEIQALQ